MNESVKGVIIRVTDYKDKDKILDIFTPNGFIVATAKGVRNPSAKLKSAVSVLTYGEFVFQSGRGKKVLSGVEPIDTFFVCWTEPKKYATAMVCCELLEKVYKKEEETTEEFLIFLKAIGEIAYGENCVATLLWFFTKCAERSGCDYRAVAEYDPDTYLLIETAAAGTETGVVGVEERDLFPALRVMAFIFKSELGFELYSLREAERLFHKM